jgi:hypothetical protein
MGHGDGLKKFRLSLTKAIKVEHHWSKDSFTVILAKVQFTVETPIIMIFCANIPGHQRSSEHRL